MKLDAYSTGSPRHAGADRPAHVIIVGGGASGVLLASHLLRQRVPIRVTIIEGQHMLGCGVAYSTTDPDHLLNTRVSNMSAYPDEPDHFLKWLRTDRPELGKTSDSFVSRSTYGAYMSQLLAPWSRDEQGLMTCIRQTCLRVEHLPHGIAAHLDDGRVVVGDYAILATGHALPDADPAGLVTGSWQSFGPLALDARVVIVGSGLSMVDQVISLLRSGHQGEIVAVSRRAQLPREHAAGSPLTVSAAEIPLGAPISWLMSWVRDLARRAEAQGGTWRDAVDGLRPHLRSIWRALPKAERARFLRHGASWWEVHRHRLPPESAAPIREGLDSGRIRLLAGSFLRGERHGKQLKAIIRPRGTHEEQAIPAARIIDCRGIRRDPQENATPLIADLLQKGAARIDPLRLGLDVGENCAILDQAGRADDRIYAVGPVSRAAFWEITAIPDIRDQARTLAAQIADKVAAEV